jgi:hypothetical protein
METVRDVRHYRAKRRPLVVLDQGRVLAAEGDREEIAELGFDSLEGAMSFQGGELVRKAGTRLTHRVQGPESVFFLKRHSGLSAFKRHWPFKRSNASPARIEWDNHLIMRRSGFDVPDPVAMGETDSYFFTPSESFLITREVPGPSLDKVLVEDLPGQLGIRDQKLVQNVIRDLAGLVRRLHSSGFYHKDLYLPHLIVKEDPRWGRPFMVDLQRVEQKFPPHHRWLVKDLAALAYSAPPSVSRSDGLRFLLQYLGKSKTDPLTRKWIREIHARLERMKEHEPAFP